MKAKERTIRVKDLEIRSIKHMGKDYISLTDMLQAKDGEFFIADWLRNRNTVEFLGIWETVNNPGFNYGEFATIKIQAGLNSFKVSAKEWISRTAAVGLLSSAGRYGGTYAHIDIALEFGMWISAEFKVYLIKEFHRLKEEEFRQLQEPRNLHRTLAKINYRIHTDAIRDHLIPMELNKNQLTRLYATEADLLNLALFGLTAADWKLKNPGAKGNQRDEATIEQLIVLSNLESLNAVLIEHGVAAPERLEQLNRAAITQMRSLLANSQIRQLHEQLRVEEAETKYGLVS